MNCWKILGLAADADERAIKRSYAALLKVHRPDEDLEAFQRLREAYEQALGLARRRAELDEAEQDSGLGDVLELPVAVVADQEQIARIHASLGDLAPPTLEAAALQARDKGQLELFERCLLERCLSDNERGYAAAHWALACLHWLTPWQEPSLPGDQLDGLLHRLLATELHGLHDLLADGNEAAFQERLSLLFGQAWLQPFERRSYFNRQLVDVLLAVPCWSEEFFQRLASRCQWSDELAIQEGWLQEWHQLRRRLEVSGLHERITSRLSLKKPDSPQARAAWLLFKPLSDGQRKRLVDKFDDKDWAACELLEGTLQQDASELLPELAPQGVQDWRIWLRSSQWEGARVCLWLLLLVPIWLGLIAYGGGFGKASLGPAAVAAATMSAVLAGLLTAAQRTWIYCTGWLTQFDVAMSKVLLPDSWTRKGSGILIIRHLLPCVAIAGVVSVVRTRGDVDWLSGLLAGLLAFAYADFNTKVGPPLVLLRTYLGNFKHWGKVLFVAGLLLFAMAVFLISQQRGVQRLEGLSEYSVQRFSGNQGPFELKVPGKMSCKSAQYGGCDLADEVQK